jgi:membrane protein
MGSRASSAWGSWAQFRTVPARRLLRELGEAVERNRLAVFASAIAYRFLIATVPLILLGLALLSAFGLRSTWTNSLRPAIEPHVQPPVARAIDFTVEQIFRGDSSGLIFFAGAWVLWNLSLAMNVVMAALNEIHDVRESRSLSMRIALAAGLGASIGALVIGAMLILSAAPLIGGHTLHLLFGIGRWIVAPCMLVIAVTLLFRFGPAERPDTEWASVGSALVVLVWLGASALFFWWVTVANYKSAAGTLVVLLTITLYIFISSAIFLLGAQLDELLRKRVRKRS